MIRQTILRVILRSSVVMLYLVFSLSAVIWLDFQRFANTPQAPDISETEVWVQPGQGLKQISHTLQQQGLIRSAWKFQLLAYQQQKGRKLKAGEFLLSGDMTPNDILDVLASGKIRLHRVTIPEGLNLYETANLLEERGFLDGAEFVALATNPEFAQRLGVEADRLEGYLFPDTYLLPRALTASRMVEMMVKQFHRRITPEIEARAAELGFSLHEVVTLASLIEKEAVMNDERWIISSVFHNRLKRNMRLDSDPTAVYGLEDFEGPILRRHLQIDSPYNTYRFRGLPIGPIANPGLNSIQAAVDPLETDYLFFVARGDLTHKFTTSLEEHNQAVQKYIRGRNRAMREEQ